jgi:hypothetical protein
LPLIKLTATDRFKHYPYFYGMKSTLYLLPFLLLSLTLSSSLSAQQDSAQSFSMVAGSFGLQLPGGDLADRYGASFSIGPAFLYKSSKNILFGVDYNYIYSENVKDASTLFSGIANTDGNIIDGNGMFAEYYLYESAFQLAFRAGRIYPLHGTNQNSGLMFTAALGLLQHKTWIYMQEDTAPQITGEYKKGYDRLRNGLSINQFAGYFHASDKGNVNYFVGIEATQALTKSRRSYDFTTMGPNNTTNIDLLWGIKFAWFFPIYRTIPKDYYYY